MSYGNTTHLVLIPGAVRAAPQALSDRPGEHCTEQSAAELLGRRDRGGINPPGAYHGPTELEQEILLGRSPQG
jgi:hypothetical protein